jgi:hypothetical protein
MDSLKSIKSSLNKDTIVSKILFLFVLLIGIVIFLRIVFYSMTLLSKNENSPRLINGMVEAKNAIVIPQDPNSNGAISIGKSKNEKNGIEFTWSVWIFIDDLQYLSGKYKNVFYKGINHTNMAGVNGPGLYIAPNTNALVVIMNTYSVINEEIHVPNIPLNKWVNVIIRCENNKLDVFINGTITRSMELNGVPKQNYGDVYIAANGGFSGYISNLWYYNYALGTLEISNLVKQGPNTTLAYSMVNDKLSKYLSLRWYFYGSGNGYNPTHNLYEKS